MKQDVSGGERSEQRHSGADVFHSLIRGEIAFSQITEDHITGFLALSDEQQSSILSWCMGGTGGGMPADKFNLFKRIYVRSSSSVQAHIVELVFDHFVIHRKSIGIESPQNFPEDLSDDAARWVSENFPSVDLSRSDDMIRAVCLRISGGVKAALEIDSTFKPVVEDPDAPVDLLFPISRSPVAAYSETGEMRRLAQFNHMDQITEEVINEFLDLSPEVQIYVLSSWMGQVFPLDPKLKMFQDLYSRVADRKVKDKILELIFDYYIFINYSSSPLLAKWLARRLPEVSNAGILAKIGTIMLGARKRLAVLQRAVPLDDHDSFKIVFKPGY